MALNEDSAWINELLSLTSDWYWEQDESFRFTYFSDGYDAMGGPERQALIGTARWEQPALNMEAHDWAQHRAQLEAHERFRDLILCRRLGDGSRRWASVSGVPVFDAGGRFTGYRGFSRDITIRYLAQEALADKERELRNVLESVPGMISRVETNARFTYANQRYADSVGQSPESIVGRSVAEVLGEARAAESERHARRAAQGEVVVYPRVLPDGAGGLRHLEVRVVADRRSSGEVAGYYSLVTDVTDMERIRSEARRRAGEQRVLLDAMPAGIARFDLEERFTYCNQRFGRITGADPATIAGRSAREVLGAKAYAAQAGQIANALAGRIARYQRTLPAEGGGEARYEVVLIPDESEGGVTGAHALVTDITELTRARDSLREKERELSHLLDSIPAIVARISLDEHYTYANIQFCSAYRSTRANVIGNSMLEVLGPQVRAQMTAYLARVAARETVEYERELRDERGQLRHFRVHLVPDLDFSGEVRGTYVFAIDITETRSQARRAEALLAQLTEANRELEAFAYTVSHDLRSPLRAIGGFATLLGREAGESLDAQAQQQLGRIVSNAERMTQLIDGLLRLSQIARHSLTKVSLAPDELVDEIFAEHEAEVAARTIRLQRGRLPRCVADPVLLRRVFANLIDNAIKYTSKRADAEIEIGAIDEGGRTAYFVRDNGAGFDPRYAGKLFGVFERLHGENEFPGTGIGLATVKRIIERHGGRIRAEGAPGRGATFTFTLSD